MPESKSSEGENRQDAALRKLRAQCLEVAELPLPNESWLEKVSAEFREKEVELQIRPIRAFRKWARKHSISTPEELSAISYLGTPVWNMIHGWFTRHSALATVNQRSYCPSCFSFDGHFWRMDIALVMTQIRVEPRRSLTNMDQASIRRLLTDPKRSEDFYAHWLDASDFFHGFHNLERFGSLPSFAIEMLRATHKHLVVAATLLTERGDSKAAEETGLAVEMAFKCLLAGRTGFDSNRAADEFGHRLVKLAKECRSLIPASDLEPIETQLGVFPHVNARYDDKQLPHRNLWSTF